MTAMPVTINTMVADAQPAASLRDTRQKLAFDLVGPWHPQRAQVESTIAQRFADVYGADVTRFMPLQLCLRLNDDIVATVGIRAASSSALFLEHYLDAPVEQVASAALGCSVERCDIVEIGNLVSTWRGSSQWLFIALTLLLCEQRQPWVTFTATQEVQKLLRRLDIVPVALVQADADRLGIEKSSWGSYYSQKPLVMITHAPTAKQKLLAHPLLSQCVADLEPFIREVQMQWQQKNGSEHVITH